MDQSIESWLAETVTQARAIFGDALRAAVLFGSAAEDRLRERSDLNLILVLARFERGAAERFGGPYRAAHAAIRLNIMFLLESETGAVASAFAVKFLDIKHRHHVLFGADPFATLEIAPQAIAARLRQALNNLRLRLRETYTLINASEDFLRGLVAGSSRAETSGKAPVPQDPYAIAYLRSGAREAIGVAAASLLDRGLIGPAEKGASGVAALRPDASPVASLLPKQVKDTGSCGSGSSSSCGGGGSGCGGCGGCGSGS